MRKLLLIPVCLMIATSGFAAEPILRNKVPLTTEKRAKSTKGKQKNTVSFKPGKGNCNINEWSKAGKKKAKKS